MSAFKNILRTEKLRKTITVVTDSLKTAVDLAKDPTPLNFAHQASILAKKGMSVYTEKYSYSSICSTWRTLKLSTTLSNMVYVHMKGINGSYSSGDMKMTEIDGVTMVYMHEKLYVDPEEDHEELLQTIGRIMVESIGPRFTLTVTPTKYFSFKLALASMSLPDLPSERATEIYDRVSAFTNAGLHRSLFLYGPPGTGKTCLATTVAAKVGGVCLRLPTEHSNLSEVVELVKLFRPDVFIMDDMNNSNEPSAAFLKTLEELNKLVKLLIVTSNTVDLSAALIRPGRFDEIVEVLTLGPEVVKSLIGDILAEVQPPQAVVADIYTWPSAFIVELADRVNALGTIVFMREYKILSQRVGKNSCKYDKEAVAAAANQKALEDIVKKINLENAGTPVEAK